MPHRDTVVSKGFRSTVLSTFPLLAQHPDPDRRRRWLCFLDLLCFSTFLESSMKRPRPVISRDEILKAIGLPTSTPSKDFNAESFLDEIVADGVLGNFRYEGHVPDSPRTSGRARIAIPNFSKEFRESLEREIASLHLVPEKDRIHLVTGEPWRATTPAQIRNDDRSTATVTRPSIREAQRIVDYLNDLPSNVFAAKVKANVARAIEVASKLEERQRHGELAKLHRIVSQPQPFYGPSKGERTVRVFAQNVAIQNLKNEVKYALIDGWVTFDLRSSQLAIVSKDWGIDDLRTWLSDFDNNNVWSRLTALFPGIPTSTSKPALKTAVYSVCYGAGKKRIRRELAKGLEVTEDAVEPFFHDPFISKVLRQRRLMTKGIIEAKQVRDCFGQTLTCAGKEDVRSVMAQLSQAQEMALLLPAIDLAKKREGEFKIVLWEHDGFSVHFTRKDRIESESQRIMDAVNERCSKLGYPTRLERKAPLPTSKPTV
ncbi:MAG: hypothetical protein KF850_20030 [Labilithrix sp.]|nr:hypothetical protein [Labilithrix sp.]